MHRCVALMRLFIISSLLCTRTPCIVLLSIACCSLKHLLGQLFISLNRMGFSSVSFPIIIVHLHIPFAGEFQARTIFFTSHLIHLHANLVRVCCVPLCCAIDKIYLIMRNSIKLAISLCPFVGRDVIKLRMN